MGATIRINWESQCRPSKCPKFLGPQNNSLLESLGQWYVLYYKMASGLFHYVRRPAVPPILYGQTETATYFMLAPLSLSCSTRGQNIVTIFRGRRKEEEKHQSVSIFWNVIILGQCWKLLTTSSSKIGTCPTNMTLCNKHGVSEEYILIYGSCGSYQAVWSIITHQKRENQSANKHFIIINITDMA